MNGADVLGHIGLAGADRLIAGVDPMFRASGESPVGFLSRVAGLGAYEQQAGIPKWAWLGVGFIAGATVVWVWGDKVRKVLP